jgi:hypothetical protein
MVPVLMKVAIGLTGLTDASRPPEVPALVKFVGAVPLL